MLQISIHLIENLFPFHVKEMGTKNVVDLSSFFLVEATGDSEVDFDPNLAIIDLADDDAESCSCDVSEDSCVGDLNGCEVEGCANVVDDQEEEQEQEQEKEKEKEEIHVYHSWTGEHTETTAKQKSCVSVDSTNESMNEMEKNRLFWEACLAS